MIVPIRTLQKYWKIILVFAIALLAFTSFFSLAFGAVPITLSQLTRNLLSENDPQLNLIVQNLRLPRVLLALCVGAMLASCGAVTQGLFRNPLADPSLIGVGAGASVGASLVIVIFDSAQWSLSGLSLVSVGAFLGGIISVIFVYKISTGAGGTSVSTMLLAGIAITFLAGSFSKVLEFIADNEMLRRISLWQMGGLESANFSQLGIGFFAASLVLLLLPLHYSALNAMLLGESEARHLGIDVKKVKQRLIVLVAIGVGVSVALVGTITFIGLVIPHMVRLIIGPNHRYLIPLCAIFGAFLLVVSDTFARTIIAPTEVPVGLVTTFIGAPVFISLLRRRHQYGMQ